MRSTNGYLLQSYSVSKIQIKYHLLKSPHMQYICSILFSTSITIIFDYRPGALLYSSLTFTCLSNSCSNIFRFSFSSLSCTLSARFNNACQSSLKESTASTSGRGKRRSNSRSFTYICSIGRYMSSI